MFFVYILQSEKSGKFYIGHTNDLGRRLSEHNNPTRNKYSSKYIPWRLVFSFEVSVNRGDAIRIERFLKRQKSTDFITKIINQRDNPDNFKTLIKNVLGQSGPEDSGLIRRS